MEERDFVQRNKRIHLQELTDVVAVRADDGSERTRSGSGFPATVAADVPASQVQAFEDAGWVFQDRASAESAAEAPRAKVFVKDGGRLALGTNLLTVQFPNDVSDDEANSLLQPFGSRVTERLTFAPGLFQIAVTDDAPGDAIEVANRLVEAGLVEFAEPVLIEAAGPRSG